MPINIGYCTIFEALITLEAHGKSNRDLASAFVNGELRVFVYESRGKYDVEILRVPREDLLALSQTWDAWFDQGRVPEPPPDDSAYKDADRAYWNDRTLPKPQRTAAVHALHMYQHKKLFISEKALNRWLGKEKQKTGAPGKPSSMHMVLAEFARRRTSDECANSRSEEAAVLSHWLRVQHPTAPQCTPKTILNKLPGDFQPRSRIPK